MLTKEEKETIYLSLSLRAGLIETGDACLRAVDAVRQKKPVRALSVDQMKVLIMIEDLMQRTLDDKL